MQVTRDTEMQGVAMVFNNMTEILESAQKQDAAGVVPTESSASWSEMRHLASWNAVARECNNPWSEGTERVLEVGEEIAKSLPPQPVSIRRQRRWSEDSGDLDIDRILGNAEAPYRESYRATRPNLQNIAIMCDVSSAGFVTNERLFYRSAAVIAAVDILEESGYRCEVWAYDLGQQCYIGTKDHNSFIAFQAKGLGDSLDIDTMAKCLSPWFFRTCLFANYSLGGKVAIGKGYSTTDNRERWFGRHCQVDSSLERIWMPSATSLRDSIAAVKTILTTIQQPVA